MEPFRRVDPDVLFQLLPGAPLRPKGVNLDPEYFDSRGYQVAGDIRIILTMASMRPGDPGNPYDVDLVYRLLVMDTIARAEQVFDAELDQTLRFGRHVDIELPRRLQADVARSWRSPNDGDASLCVAQLRYRNYVMRYVGQINQSGYFPTQESFLSMVQTLDAQIPKVLEDAT